MEATESSAISALLESEDEVLPWSVTYADMMTLLLVFFILLYTVFFYQSKEFEERLASIQVVIDDQGNTSSMLEFARAGKTGAEPVVLEEITGLKGRKAALLTELEEAAKQQQWQQFLYVEISGKNLLISIDGSVLFPVSSARITDVGLVILYTLLEIFERYPEYQVNIQEHSTDQSEQVLGLSTYRAAEVMRYFIDQGFVTKNMTATGFAELKAPIQQSLSYGFTSDRRLDFVLEKENN